MKKIYTAVVTAKGGREGTIRSADGVIDLQLRKPKEMEGEEGYVNPELLFAGAWGSCYLGALGSVGKSKGVDVSGATVDVHVSFNEESEKHYALSAELHVKVPGIPVEKAQELADIAHKNCPYSKATKGNIEVKVIAQ